MPKKILQIKTVPNDPRANDLLKEGSWSYLTSVSNPQGGIYHVMGQFAPEPDLPVSAAVPPAVPARGAP